MPRGIGRLHTDPCRQAPGSTGACRGSPAVPPTERTRGFIGYDLSREPAPPFFGTIASMHPMTHWCKIELPGLSAVGGKSLTSGWRGEPKPSRWPQRAEASGRRTGSGRAMPVREEGDDRRPRVEAAELRVAEGGRRRPIPSADPDPNPDREGPSLGRSIEVFQGKGAKGRALSDAGTGTGTGTGQLATTGKGCSRSHLPALSYTLLFFQIQ